MQCFEHILKLNQIKGVYVDPSSEQDSLLEELYLQVREKEGRLYPDEVVDELPVMTAGLFAEEWRRRSRSAARLKKYFSHQTGGCLIDLGCGNGWFSNMLAQNDGLKVLGLDKNRQELEQAARVFKRDNLLFVNGDVFSLPLPLKGVDYITIGAAIQYFEDFDHLLKRLFELLNEKGEVHIFDSPFYEEAAIEKAESRSADYYRQLGFPEMASFYRHHMLNVLRNFSHDFLYNPRSHSVLRKILPWKDMPFPWIRIVKS